MQPKIIVIGAGAAGIAAATKLISKGFTEVTVLEAENRIGGRIYSPHLGGNVVDLGAQWVHGEKGNIVYQMVKDLNLTDYTKKSANYESGLNFLISNNSAINQNLASELNKTALSVLDNIDAEEGYNSVEEYFKIKFYEIIKSKFGNSDEVLKTAKMIEEWAEKFLLCLDPAESWEQLSAKSEYKKCEGHHLIHWKNTGFATFIDVLIKTNANISKDNFIKQHVLLNKQVNKINWTNCKAKVYCTDGSTYSADHVILTVSVAVLRNTYKTLFEPPLPTYKVNCVENIPLGTSHKIIMKFETKWWPDGVKDFSFLWTEEDKRVILEEFPEGPTLNNRSWLEYLFGFYTVEFNPTILLGWYVGPMTKEVEALPDEIVQRGSLFLLKKFVGHLYDVPEPADFTRSKWGINPNFLGTYSYSSTNMHKSGATHEDLAKPLLVGDKEVVLFAGEATHFSYFSTVHGAVETGLREAERIYDMYNNIAYHQTVIIGAGLAGLGAAKQLAENGITDFKIFEAMDKAGGRIETIFINDKALDLGAQWMHGKDNPLYRFALENSLLSDIVSEEGIGQYIRSNGELVDSLTVDLIAFEIGKILTDCEKLVSSDNPPPSLQVFLDENFQKYLDEQDLTKEQTEIYWELYDWHIRFQVIDNSCRDLTRLSAKSWGEYSCPDDEAHSNLKNGYQSLVDAIVDTLPDNCIQYNCEIITIKVKDNKQIQLEVKNVGPVICDHLILTPSLGVLKQFKGLSEVLSDSVMTNIQKMGFAAIAKVFLFYDEKWWGDSGGFQLLWNKDFKFGERESWLRTITGFDEVFNHELALMTWVGGDAVQEVENLDEKDIARHCTELLRKFLVNYSIPMPKKVIRTRWHSNPFVKGSYCHITPECDARDSGIRALGKPLFIDCVPRIILAGEAVHPSHYSTTHGAYESGLDQAQVICDYVRKSK
ncbi:spermine oxidase-like isoform X2 [Anthonomus grandis grandis]|nr:spermine oxidase-like isoform X2 [Anthonomus grandis grandis]XP_050297421.1 spermine oxidase-like isoform X2 [Anthonomus grandis grandis]